MVFTIYIRDIYHISQNFSAPSAPVQNVLIYMVYGLLARILSDSLEYCYANCPPRFKTVPARFKSVPVTYLSLLDILELV